ncbi:hypothetical protein ACVIWU_001576 [Bradyrhizobium sp. USDA 4509]
MGPIFGIGRDRSPKIRSHNLSSPTGRMIICMVGLGARENIDWHAFSYDKSFTPAARATRTLLSTNASDVSKATNLTAN